MKKNNPRDINIIFISRSDKRCKRLQSKANDRARIYLLGHFSMHGMISCLNNHLLFS
ncbi:hypothetical protein PAJ34TS1_01400 [Paenibacillus azoreducens]|uniref:Uncharacterized protein n=1 Tax=Paenibacillus azoreducens TaxID=116718 RepID=A0A919YBV6_9BACL|nr:hypothetical protein J34TS1_35210 [Paenibacillus azoreducens]